jgi:hypothetical protein
MSKVYIPRPGAEVAAFVTPRTVQAASADGAITIRDGVVFITKATAAALTLAAPNNGEDNGKVLYVIATTAAAHTVTISGGLNGAGASADVGTFGGAVGDQFAVVAYNGVWYRYGAFTNVTFA